MELLKGKKTMLNRITPIPKMKQTENNAHQTHYNSNLFQNILVALRKHYKT